jgi:hypothetical protein
MKFDLVLDRFQTLGAFANTDQSFVTETILNEYVAPLSTVDARLSVCGHFPNTI